MVGSVMEQKVFDCIVEYIKEYNYPPSIRDLCKLTGLKSTSSVHRYVHNLMNKGKIETNCKFGISRALGVVGYKFRKL